MGSADIMPRNLNNRVEVLFPIENEDMIMEIKEGILDIYLQDNIRAWEANAKGDFNWICDDPETAFDVQAWFIEKAEKANRNNW